jgi:hypothetical protein
MCCVRLALHIVIMTNGHLRSERHGHGLGSETMGNLETVKCENNATRDCKTCSTRGPIHLCDVKAAFETSGQELLGCGDFKECGVKTAKVQLPKIAQPFFRDGTFDWLASEPILLQAAKSEEDISPAAYPHAATDLRTAIMRSAGLKDKDVLVAGSVTPWIESIVKMYSPRSITTSDYNVKTLKSNLTKFVQVESLNSMRAMFDAIFSFSSIEHDGLGRYCDPINPDGDKAAMREFYQLLRPGGMLFLGVPVDGSLTKTHVVNNMHRVYSKKGLADLTCGFKNIQIVQTHYGFSKCAICTKGSWQNQPWFIMHA